MKVEFKRFLPIRVLGKTGEQCEDLAADEGIEDEGKLRQRAQEIGAADPLVDYAEMFRNLAINPAQGAGATNDEVRLAIPFCDRLEEAVQLKKSHVGCTAGEYNMIKRRLDDFRWRFAHRNIMTFLDEFRDAPSSDPEAAAAIQDAEAVEA